ncbi:MAG: Na+/H+ antiporter subunit C [Anaerolineales bacterium]|jgi:multicomponent Na+:H+ antiporter subunit C|nr:Na+/H+ antiporter subunit C [Anaerolineales bacterium]
MVILLAITAGVLFAAAIYMILRRSLVKILVGLLLLSYAVNLLLFNSADLIPARPPLIAAGSQQPPAVTADPVPQALILTAIVISFGLTAFAVVLMRQVYSTLGTDDLYEMRCTDIPCVEVNIASEEELMEEPL